MYNGDFELYDTCPVSLSVPGNLQIERCLGWTAPTKMGTSDYFNFCNNYGTTLAGVPVNLLGFQQPFNGNGYGGFLAWVIGSSNGQSYREYLQTKLIQPLIAGTSYDFSFYVSYYGYNYSVEKIGALFSVNDYYSNSFLPIIASPQIVNSTGPITDSLGWTKISGSFIANGGEQYLTIGYFEDSLSVVDTLNTFNDPFVYMESYYYVDGVQLIEKPLLLPNVFSPNDDGQNDVFYIPGMSADDWVEIYNRWGIKVSELSNGNQSWDGRTTSGEQCTSGVYFYTLKKKENNELIKGFVQLIR